MRSILIPAILAGLVLIGLWTPEVLAQKKKVEILRKWNGKMADRNLLKTAPNVIVSKAELEKIWKAWKIEGELPNIDFKKEIVVVVTSLQAGIGLSDAKLDEKGNLELTAMVTQERDGATPGFRFVLATVSREGIVSVQGKKVPND